MMPETTIKEKALRTKEGQQRLEIVPCNLCGAEDATRLYRIDGFQIVRCRKCGLIYVNPRLVREEVEKIYSQSEYFHNPKFYQFDGYMYGYAEYISERQEIERSFEKVVQRLQVLTSPGHLFDIGCGPGYFLEVARRHGWEVTGMEISEAAVRYARHRLGLDVVQGSFEEQVLPPISFDAGVLLDVIEHFHDPFSALQKVHALLRPGGVVTIATPNAGSLLARLLGGRWEDMRRVKEHLYLFSEKTLTLMLQKTGFRVLKVHQYGRHFKVGKILRRWEFYHKGTARFLQSASRLLGFYDKTYYIVPFTKMIVFAEKV